MKKNEIYQDYLIEHFLDYKVSEVLKRNIFIYIYIYIYIYLEL